MPDSFKRRAMAILWPSFLMAGVLEGLVFAAFDPQTFRFGGIGEISPQAVYTLSFFMFWLVLSTSGALTAVLWFEPDDRTDTRPPEQAPDRSAS